MEKTVERIQEDREEGEVGIFIVRKINCHRYHIFSIVIYTSQHYRHAKSQSQTIFHYGPMLNYTIIDHHTSFFTIGVNSYLISPYITLILSSYILPPASLFLAL